MARAPDILHHEAFFASCAVVIRAVALSCGASIEPCTHGWPALPGLKPTRWRTRTSQRSRRSRRALQRRAVLRLQRHSGRGHLDRLRRRAERRTISQAELQQDMQRFTSQFLDRVNQASAPLSESKQPERREMGARLALAYMASSLDIATGQYPEINMVDMLVFVKRGCRRHPGGPLDPGKARQRGAPAANGVQELRATALRGISARS